MRRVAGAGLSLVALAALPLAWRLSQAPPLYDGVCLSAPYRVLGHDPAPLSASKAYPAEPAGAFPTDEVTSNGTLTPDNPRYENPAQAQILVMSGTFVSSTPFTISVTPVAPPAAAPPGQTIDGNVYRFAATTVGGTQLQPQPQEPATILLRATASTPPKTMYRYSDGTWTALKTFNAGCGDTFEAVSPTLGDFALLAPAPASSSGAGGLPFVPIVIGILIVAAAAAAGLAYLNRGPRR